MPDLDTLPSIGGAGTGDTPQDDLLPSAFWDQCLTIGEFVPDFTLPNVRGELVGLDDLLDAGPVVVSFQHDSACPCCQRNQRLLLEAEPAIVGAGATLVVVSAATANEREQRLGAWSELLCDPGGKVAGLFGLLCRVPAGRREVLRRAGVALADPRPSGECVVQARAIYVIDSHGVVAYAAVTLGQRQEPDPTVIAATLTGLREQAEAID